MRLNQRGSIQSSALLTVGFAVLFVASTAFGIWAFMGRADYKNNSDKKSATAVATAKEEQKATDEADFLEREKQPYETFDGSSEFGSIKIVYPKPGSFMSMSRLLEVERQLMAMLIQYMYQEYSLTPRLRYASR